MVMTASLEQLCSSARRAAQTGNWAIVKACAAEILRRDARSAEGYFLAGLAEKAARRPQRAVESFARALELDPGRYDAAIELAEEYARSGRHGDALTLLERHEPQLANSPRYLNLAGLTWSLLGMHERAWPLHRRANELQPGAPLFEANLAACSVYLGKIDEARELYLRLLERNPNHQRNHYHLARLARARDAGHVEQMKAVLAATRLPPEKNIFIYYALGKELEDLEQWDEAFHYYKLAGDAATSVSHYDVAEDIALIDRIIEVCNAEWLAAGPAQVPTEVTGKTPIFIVGLPRTGTTLTERILSSHSQVESLGETLFLPMVVRQVSGVPGGEGMTPAMITAAAQQDIRRIADGYLNAVRHRLGDRPFFIEKFPENILHLGFVAKAFPDARLVHLRRHPMDACFAMYKQSFFRYAYTLDNVGRFFTAYDRLARHWRALLGERLVEVQYETLVGDQDVQTRWLLERLGLPFEQACLEFDRNESASATASSVQVREKIHTRSVQRWRNFERQLQPLRIMLERAGIAID